MKELSLEQLIEGRKKPLANAADLIRDAEVLLNNGRWARCAFLAYIAIEELGKYLIIMGAIGRVLMGNVDWKRFWKRFRKHKQKAANIMMFDAMLGPFVSMDDTLARVKRSYKQTDDQEKEKLSSLYVDFCQDRFVAPMGHINEQDACKALDSARAVFKFFDERETHVFSDMSPDNLTPEMFTATQSLLYELDKEADDNDATQTEPR